jgi:hypothetical protein
MLRGLVIFAGLAIVTQAPVPVPRQAADDPAGGSQKASDQHHGKDGFGNPGIPVVGKISEGESRKDTDQPRSKNDDQAVTISKFPPVSVTKDWADWSYWGFGGLLFIVGALQAWFLWRTLTAIKAQGGHMERQTKILEASVAAAQKSADAAAAQIEFMKSKERAQLRIEFANLDLVFDQELRGYPIHFRVTLDGTTRAYIMEDSIVADIPSYPMADRRYWSVTGLPRNFTPELSPFVGNTLLRTNEFPPELETDNLKIGLVREGKLSVRVQGRIRYRDIFGDKWDLSIHRAWSHGTGMWAGAGKDGDDGHRQILET